MDFVNGYNNLSKINREQIMPAIVKEKKLNIIQYLATP